MEGLLNKLYIEPIEPIGKFFISLLKLKLVKVSTRIPPSLPRSCINYHTNVLLKLYIHYYLYIKILPSGFKIIYYCSMQIKKVHLNTYICINVHICFSFIIFPKFSRLPLCKTSNIMYLHMYYNNFCMKKYVCKFVLHG